MAYSAKTGDVNVFAKAIIDVGTKRRAQEESERKALVNSEKYTEPKPRIINGGMDTSDKLKAVAVKEIAEAYTAVPVAVKAKSRPVPSSHNVRRATAETQKSEAVPMATKNIEVKKGTRRVEAVPTATKEIKSSIPERTKREVPVSYYESAPQPQREKRRYVSTIKTKKDKNRQSAPLGTITAIMVITVFLVYFLMLCIQSFEIKHSISELKGELSEKETTLSTWQTKLDEKTPSLDKIEEFAEEDGMIRKTPDKYISVTPPEDVIERYDSDNNPVSGQSE